MTDEERDPTGSTGNAARTEGAQRVEKAAKKAARGAARSAARTAARDAADAAAAKAAETGAPSQDEMTIAFTPKQLFTGFAILAGLVLLARRRGRRAGRSAPDVDEG